jgi:hypothetical protein
MLQRPAGSSSQDMTLCLGPPVRSSCARSCGSGTWGARCLAPPRRCRFMAPCMLPHLRRPPPPPPPLPMNLTRSDPRPWISPACAPSCVVRPVPVMLQDAAALQLSAASTPCPWTCMLCCVVRWDAAALQLSAASMPCAISHVPSVRAGTRLQACGRARLRRQLPAIDCDVLAAGHAHCRPSTAVRAEHGKRRPKKPYTLWLWGARREVPPACGTLMAC